MAFASTFYRVAKKKPKYNNVKAVYTSLKIQLLPPPYATNCRVYDLPGGGRKMCFSHCIKRRLEKLSGKIPFNTIENETLSVEIVNEQDLLNKTFAGDLRAIEDACFKNCEQESCFDSFFLSILQKEEKSDYRSVVIPHLPCTGIVLTNEMGWPFTLITANSHWKLMLLIFPYFTSGTENRYPWQDSLSTVCSLPGPTILLLLNPFPDRIQFLPASGHGLVCRSSHWIQGVWQRKSRNCMRGQKRRRQRNSVNTVLLSRNSFIRKYLYFELESWRGDYCINRIHLLSLYTRESLYKMSRGSLVVLYVCCAIIIIFFM